MKSFSVNLTEAEWYGILHLLDEEIGALKTWIEKQRRDGWSNFSAVEADHFGDYYLRLKTSCHKIRKKIEENS